MSYAIVSIKSKIISKMFNYTEADKMTVCININMIRGKLGLNTINIDHMLEKSYESLHDAQNSLLEHYNQAVKNTPKE